MPQPAPPLASPQQPSPLVLPSRRPGLLPVSLPLPLLVAPFSPRLAPLPSVLPSPRLPTVEPALLDPHPPAPAPVAPPAPLAPSPTPRLPPPSRSSLLALAPQPSPPPRLLRCPEPTTLDEELDALLAEGPLPARGSLGPLTSADLAALDADIA